MDGQNVGPTRMIQALIVYPSTSRWYGEGQDGSIVCLQVVRSRDGYPPPRLPTWAAGVSADKESTKMGKPRRGVRGEAMSPPGVQDTLS